MTERYLDGGRRRAREAFVVADRSKPSLGDSCEDACRRSRDVASVVAGWTDEDLEAAVTDPARRSRFSEFWWSPERLALDEVAVWPSMGGLPPMASSGSPLATAAYLSRHGVPDEAARMRKFLRHADEGHSDCLAAVCRAQPLLVVPYISLHGRAHPTLKWAFDDGSHRAVVLAMLTPDEKVEVLVGQPTSVIDQFVAPPAATLESAIDNRGGQVREG